MGGNPDRELLAGGRYRLVRRIARGGVATVYEGLAVELGKRVAIKVIDERFLGSREVVERFRQEARAATAIESEHIVDVYDVGEDPRVGLFLVMELLAGEDLAGRMARVGRLEPDVASAVALQAAWALGKAHAAGVVHRDLKPENLFLVERTVPGVFVKLLDFGVAKLARRVQADALTAHGSTLGTPQYMSPEQIQAAPDVDARADVWSLGAVFFEALAGRPAFEEKATFAETMLQICEGRPPRLLDVAPWVPPRLAAIVDDALEPDRARRLPDAATFAQRILEVMPDALAPLSLMVTAHEAALATSERLRTEKDRSERLSAYPDIASEPSSSADEEEGVFARLGTPSSLRPLDPVEVARTGSSLPPLARSVPSAETRGSSVRPSRVPHRPSRAPLSPAGRVRAGGALAAAAAAALAVAVWMLAAAPARALHGSAAAAPRAALRLPRTLAKPPAPPPRPARGRVPPGPRTHR